MDAVQRGKIDIYEMDQKAYKEYRKDLRKQIREHHKYMCEDSDDDFEEYVTSKKRSIEDYVYYGSDS